MGCHELPLRLLQPVDGRWVVDDDHSSSEVEKVTTFFKPNVEPLRLKFLRPHDLELDPEESLKPCVTAYELALKFSHLRAIDRSNPTCAIARSSPSASSTSPKKIRCASPRRCDSPHHLGGPVVGLV